MATITKHYLRGIWNTDWYTLPAATRNTGLQDVWNCRGSRSILRVSRWSLPGPVRMQCCRCILWPSSTKWHCLSILLFEFWYVECWMHLSDHSPIATLVNTFSSFFISRISVIRSSFPPDSHSRVLNSPDTRKVLQNLSCVSADEVCHLVLQVPCKSSNLDPIPTSLEQDCIDILITPITSLINLSLTEGSFPLHFKSTHVSPLLKKPSLNKDSMKNYRAVANLSFFSKVLEKVVVNQLNTHINSSNTSNQYQSAYRKFHRIETRWAQENCFLDFAVKHWFGCRATEPRFAGDIGAIKAWLIDWLIIFMAHDARP